VASKKHNELNRKLEKSKTEIVLERDQCCQLCGRSDQSLSFMHIISKRRAINISKESLYYDEENIWLACYIGSNTCHYEYDFSGFPKFLEYCLKRSKQTPEIMDNLWEMLEFIRREDPQGYLMNYLSVRDTKHQALLDQNVGLVNY